ncbi:Pol [Symbiodinium natans]|uniref:Pol protein n=1 Tax=Symbiodinium natans TaxID=878477 RepID=A0A812NC07_9DINO|nr:Pol [Symbiodinium natans]
MALRQVWLGCRRAAWMVTARPRCGTALGGLVRPPSTVPPASALCARRTYLESMDRSVTVYSFTDPMELLNFMDANSDSDLRTFEAALRTLGRLSAGPAYKEVVGDGRFHAILSALATRLDDCDATMLSKISDASARFRTTTPELADLAQRLAEVVCRREDMFSPRNLANVAIALALRGVRDVPTVEFVRNEVWLIPPPPPSGPLVLWSPGPLVPWSSGPLVLWSPGPLVPWSRGPLGPVVWSRGPLLPWSCCSLGPAVLWSPGPVVPLVPSPWSSGSAVLSSCGLAIPDLNL